MAAIERRTVLKAAAWSAPVVAIAVAAPAAAASRVPGSAPAVVNPMNWLFTAPNDQFTNGYYDFKRTFTRMPGGQIDQNTPFRDPSVRFTMTVVLDNSPSGANGEAQITGPSSISFAPSAHSEWTVSAATMLNDIWTIVLTAVYGPGTRNNIVPFAQGTSMQNVYFRIPTRSQMNQGPVSLLPYLSLRIEGVGIAASGNPIEGFQQWGPGAPQS